MRREAWTLAVCVSLLSIGLRARSMPPPQSLTWDGPDGVSFTVAADGLSSVRVGEREVASGGWYAWNAGPCWFGRGTNDLLAYTYYSRELYGKAAAALTEKSIEVMSPNAVRVRHRMPDAVAVFDYTFDGEDVTIRARIENNHPRAAIAVPAFGGLRFVFPTPPEGIMPVWHTSYLHAVQLGAFHPSHLNKIGGSYATAGGVGVGLTPLDLELEPSLFFWDYDDWNPGKGAAVPRRWLSYLRADPVPAGGARTFTMKLRVSRNTAWQHLLQPYKDFFLSTYGSMRYHTDDRAMGVAHVNRNAEAIGPDNPYGFHGGFRRLDLPEGVQAFCDTVIPGLKAMNGQGMIIWGQGGQEPRGQMYRADFDVLPPEVAQNWSTLRQRFDAAGLRLGVCTRPRHLHVRLDWSKDGTIDINPDDPQHLDILWKRFENMIHRGCTLFYLDSFGNSLGDVKVMRYLRERMGPDISTFAEHQCDVLAVSSGFYSETDFWGKGTADWAKDDAWRPRAGKKFLDIVRWMLGPVPVISRAYDVHGTIPAGFESATEFFCRNRITPMVEDYLLQKKAEEIRRLQAQYLGADGTWLTPCVPSEQ